MTMAGLTVRDGSERHEDETGNARGETAGAENESGTAERSKRNIREWQSYLPADCVATMIAMHWDTST